MIPIARPLIAEEEIAQVARVLSSGRLTQGAVVTEFETAFAAYIGVRHVVAVSSGTAALHLALLAERIGPGDEVITTPFTFVATVNSILAVGARPVFVDIDAATFNVDPTLLERAITRRTRAIMPIHLFGNPSSMDAVMGIARAHDIPVIEDACQAHGASYDDKRVGSFGTGCFSFYPSKNMTCGEGGMVTTDDDRIADQVRLLRNHGMKERYNYVAFGFNMRITEIQATLGITQLAKLDRMNSVRRDNARQLTLGLSPIVVCPRATENAVHVYNQYTIRVPAETRESLRRQLLSLGVATEIYYPRPLHRLPFVDDNGSYPVAERACDEVLSIPVHPLVKPEELNLISSSISRILKQSRVTG